MLLPKLFFKGERRQKESLVESTDLYKKLSVLETYLVGKPFRTSLEEVKLVLTQDTLRVLDGIGMRLTSSHCGAVERFYSNARGLASPRSSST